MHIDCDLTGNFYIYNAYIYIFYTNEEVNDIESCKDEVHQDVTENDTDINQIIKSSNELIQEILNGKLNLGEALKSEVISQLQAIADKWSTSMVQCRKAK